MAAVLQERADRARVLAAELDSAERALLLLDEPDAGRGLARLHHAELPVVHAAVRVRRWALLVELSGMAARELAEDRT